MPPQDPSDIDPVETVSLDCPSSSSSDSLSEDVHASSPPESCLHTLSRVYLSPWDKNHAEIRQCFDTLSKNPTWHLVLDTERGKRLRLHQSFLDSFRASPDKDIAFSYDAITSMAETMHAHRQDIEFSHPMPYVPDDVLDALFKIAFHGPWIKVIRATKLREFKHMASLLCESETLRRTSLPSHVDHVTRGMNVSLWKHVASCVHFPDMALFDGLSSEGLPSVGNLPRTGIHTPLAVEPEISVPTLLAWAPHVNSRFLNKPSPSLHWKDCLSSALTDCDKGFMKEIPLADFEALHQPLLAERFGVLQGNKVRPIDNYRSNWLNAATSSGERLRHETLDATTFVLQWYKFVLGVDPSLSKEDVEHAYRIVPLDGQALNLFPSICSLERYQAKVWDDQSQAARISLRGVLARRRSWERPRRNAWKA